MERIYLVAIEGREWRIGIDDGPDGRRVRVDDGPAEAVDFTRAQGRALYSLLLGGQSREMRIVADAEEHGVWQVGLDHQQMAVRVQTEREQRLSRVNAQHQVPSGPLVVKAPMPGLVKAVAVSAGETVEANQRLVVLEAMKMENDIQAPRAGIIKEIRVKPGETVQMGYPLLVIE